MRHIHADHMITAANDTSIQWEAKTDSGDWCGVGCEPAWVSNFEYRQKPSPHPHQAMIDQAKANPSIEWQILNPTGQVWCDVKIPHWNVTEQYRQKQAEPKMVDLWQWAVRRKSDGDIWATTDFFATKEDAQYHSSSKIICRIEGSKISVGVSQ
jgi:hypothetical protein